MIDWTFVEAIRAPAFDVLRTVIFAVGAIVAYIQLRESYRLRRLQVLSSLNERLASCRNADVWIYDPNKRWDELDNRVVHYYQSYLATFEDIGLARKFGIISRNDFIASYGGRFRNLYDSGTLTKYMVAGKFEPVHFENLRILTEDIGRRV